MIRTRSAGLIAMLAILGSDNGALAQGNIPFLKAPTEGPNFVFLNEMELGFGQVSEGSFKFGKFNGLEEEGAFVIGNVSFQRRAVFDDHDTTYFTLEGTNLGLTSRSLEFDYGQQGLFSIRLGFSQIPKNSYDDTRTPYVFSDEGTRLTSPPGWVPGDRDTSEMTQLALSLNDTTFEHSRERYSGGFSLLPAKNWIFRTDFTRELKDGSRSIAVLFGSNGGNPAAAVVPEPIDYRTDTLDTSISYVGKRGQFLASYHLSLFDNDQRSLEFDNLYASTRWAPVASWPDGVGSIGLAPDNQAHRLKISAAYRVDPTTRATANISYSRMTQDQTFVDFTVNPGLLEGTPLPRASLDGRIDTFLTNLTIASRPGPRLNVRARYRFEDRDNQTPRDTFIVVHNDTADQGAINSSDARINVPYSRRQHLFELGAGYRLGKDFKLSGNYEYEEISRTYSDVAKTREHKLDGKLRFTPKHNVRGWAGVSFTSRTGSTYDDNIHFIASHTPGYLGPDPEAEFENHPLIRKSYLSDRNQLKVRSVVTWMASERLTLAFSGRYTSDDYKGTLVGLTESSGYNVTLDASYISSEAFNAHAWYTFDNRVFGQFGVESRPGTDLFDFAGRGWFVETDDRANSIGMGLEWSVIEQKLDVALDATWLRAEASFDFEAGTLISALPLPHVSSELAGIDLKVDYHSTSALTLRFRYMFQELLIEDFALDGVGPDTLTDVLGAGNQPSDYGVHVFGVSTIYRF